MAGYVKEQGIHKCTDTKSNKDGNFKHHTAEPTQHYLNGLEVKVAVIADVVFPWLPIDWNNGRLFGFVYPTSYPCFI